MKKIFLDTDIIFDMLMERHPFYISSMIIFKLGNEHKIELYVSSVCFSNLFYIMNKKFSFAQTISFLKKIAKNTKILTVDKEIIMKSIESGFKDFEDAVQYFTAKKAGMDFILTRNIRDYKVDDIPVTTAEDFLRYL